MFRILISSLLFTTALAGYGYSGASYGGSSGYSGSYSRIPLAIQSRRSLSFVDVPSTYSNPAPLSITVPARTLPVHFNFHSRSSPITLNAIHESSPGSYKETYSQDAPHIRKHTVTRPVIHEVREIISPRRQVTQQILPVSEDVSRMVARGAAPAARGPSYSYGTYSARRDY